MEPSCPVCRQPVSVRLAWDLTPKNRVGFLACGTGVHCPACGTTLRIIQRHAVLAVVVVWVALWSVLAMLAGRIRLDGMQGGLALVLTTAVGMCFTLIAPRRLVTLRVRTGGDTVDFPVERLKAQVLAHAHGEPDGGGPLPEPGSYWVCRSCGEPNPNGCQVCLRCKQFDGNAV